MTSACAFHAFGVALAFALTTGQAQGRADLAGKAASAAVRSVADWSLRSRDHGQKPFAVIDKRNARLFVFDAAGRLQGAAPVLLGAAFGDHSVPGIGERPMSAVLPHERTTPAGRFVTQMGINHQGEDILWIDYAAAVSMHRVRALVPAERRLQRLASPTARDNRISFGCINVPAHFFDEKVKPLLGAARGAVVYVLPDKSPMAEFFPHAAPDD